MPRDTTLRFRCSQAEKERIDAHARQLGVETGRWLREMALAMISAQEAAKNERVTIVSTRQEEPLDARGVQLSDGSTIGKISGKRSYAPDPK